MSVCGKQQVGFRVTLLVLCLALVAGLSACGRGGKAGADRQKKAAEALRTERWPDDLDATFTNAPDAAVADGVLIVQRGNPVSDTFRGEGEFFACLRFKLGTTFLADEVRDARLFLKVRQGEVPERLHFELLTGFWDGLLTTHDQMYGLLADADLPTSVEVRAEADGWISVPVTAPVKAWLAGDAQNNGFALFSEDSDGQRLSFAAANGEGTREADTAYLRVRGAVGARANDFGAFAYTPMPLPDEKGDGGNCLAYVLRDCNSILGEDLGFDKQKLKRLYETQGLDALADYAQELVMRYVKAHAAGLEISQFRPIENYDSLIEAKTEYRIALRVGVSLTGDAAVDFVGDRSFDYHFWVEVADGQWAQKFATEPSALVPCTGPGISPATYPWDAHYQRSEKFHDFYTSAVHYFAVSKTTAEFTRHRGEVGERPLSPQ